MKKAKILLFAIAILAIAGAALAFKARTFNLNYCTAPAIAGIITCPNSFEEGKVNIIQGTAYYYTITFDPTKCLQFINGFAVGAPCSTFIKLTKE